LQASGYSFLYPRTVSPSETSIKTSTQSASFTIHKYSVSLSSHTTPNNFLNHITQANSAPCAFSRQLHHSSTPTRNPGRAGHETNQPRADSSPQPCYSPKRAMTVLNPVRVDNGGSPYIFPCMSRYSLAPRPSPNITPVCSDVTHGRSWPIRLFRLHLRTTSIGSEEGQPPNAFCKSLELLQLPRLPLSTPISTPFAHPFIEAVFVAAFIPAWPVFVGSGLSRFSFSVKHASWIRRWRVCSFV
jgi:hypothetical protein